MSVRNVALIPYKRVFTGMDEAGVVVRSQTNRAKRDRKATPRPMADEVLRIVEQYKEVVTLLPRGNH